LVWFVIFLIERFHPSPEFGAMNWVGMPLFLNLIGTWIPATSPSTWEGKDESI
jgi:hypothetical protein